MVWYIVTPMMTCSLFSWLTSTTTTITESINTSGIIALKMRWKKMSQFNSKMKMNEAQKKSFTFADWSQCRDDKIEKSNNQKKAFLIDWKSVWRRTAKWWKLNFMWCTNLMCKHRYMRVCTFRRWRNTQFININEKKMKTFSPENVVDTFFSGKSTGRITHHCRLTVPK